MDRTSRDTQSKVLLAVLAVVSVLVWIPNLNGKAKKGADSKNVNTPQARRASGVSGSEMVPDLLEAGGSSVMRQQSRFKEWGRNPMIPEGWKIDKEQAVEVLIDPEPISEASPGAPAAEIDFVLNGIFWNQDKPCVVINNEVLGIGAKAGGYEIVDITKDKVTLTNGSRRRELRVQK